MKPRYILLSILSPVVIASSTGTAFAIPMQFPYPVAGKDSHPVCYLQSENGSTLDLSKICLSDDYLSKDSHSGNSGTYMNLEDRSTNVRSQRQSGSVVNSPTSRLGASSSGGRGSRGSSNF